MLFNKYRMDLNKMETERNKRYKDFKNFYESAENIFESFKLRGEREKYFDDRYILCICPGGRWGGNDERIVEFFGGNRPYDQKNGVAFYAEHGASMLFFKNDNGYVSIQLYPAGTEQRNPKEDFILWKIRVKPLKLLKLSFQKRCWGVFMAYMEVTSLDGEPCLIQKIRVWYLRNFKNVIVERKDTPIKFYCFLRKVGTWVLTVGFSGLVIFLLQIMLSKNPAEHQNVKDIKKSINKIEEAIEYLQYDVNAIKESQDTIVGLYNRQIKMNSPVNVENNPQNK